MSEEKKKEETDKCDQMKEENSAEKSQAESGQNENPDTKAAGESEKAGSAADESLLLKQKVEELEKENASLKDQLLRRAADFENYRKRAMQEKQDAYDYGNAALLKDLLDVIDNFDRTLEASKNASDAKSIADGVEMINKSFMNMLESKYNLKAYGAPGDNFDPAIHEALMSAPGPVAEPSIKEIYLKGYTLKDKPIRLAKVVVTMPDGSVKAEVSQEKEDCPSCKNDENPSETNAESGSAENS